LNLLAASYGLIHDPAQNFVRQEVIPPPDDRAGRVDRGCMRKHSFSDLVRVRYSTHAIQGLSENDFICAAKIDRLPLI